MSKPPPIDTEVLRNPEIRPSADLHPTLSQPYALPSPNMTLSALPGPYLSGGAQARTTTQSPKGTNTIGGSDSRHPTHRSRVNGSSPDDGIMGADAGTHDFHHSRTSSPGPSAPTYDGRPPHKNNAPLNPIHSRTAPDEPNFILSPTQAGRPHSIINALVVGFRAREARCAFHLWKQLPRTDYDSFDLVRRPTTSQERKHPA